MNCPECNAKLEADEGTPASCINGVPDEGNEPCLYCEECGYESLGNDLASWAHEHDCR